MSLFDAFNHSFAAVSTGGFSTRADSIGYWDSAAVEAVTLPLMVLGNLSFVTAWSLWRGRLRFVVRNGEVRLMAALIPLSVAAVLRVHLSGASTPQLGKAFRVALFETVSALTTTGFSDGGLRKLERLRGVCAHRAHADRRRHLLDGRRHQAVSGLSVLEAADLGGQALPHATSCRHGAPPLGGQPARLCR